MSTKIDILVFHDNEDGHIEVIPYASSDKAYASWAKSVLELTENNDGIKDIDTSDREPYVMFNNGYEILIRSENVVE